MGEEKTSNSGKKALKVVVGICILLIIVQVGIALFGSWFEADKIVVKRTAKAQEDIENALFLNFNDFGRLEVCADYSVHAYISKKNYMFVPFPDRDETITRVGRHGARIKALFAGTCRRLYFVTFKPVKNSVATVAYSDLWARNRPAKDAATEYRNIPNLSMSNPRPPDLYQGA